MLHLDHSRKLICEHEASLLSKTMRQVLLPHVGGDPYSGHTISLVYSSIVASPNAHPCTHATHSHNSHHLSHLTYVQEIKTKKRIKKKEGSITFYLN